MLAPNKGIALLVFLELARERSSWSLTAPKLYDEGPSRSDDPSLFKLAACPKPSSPCQICICMAAAKGHGAFAC